MAEPRFDRERFGRRLATRRLGRTLIVRAETASTNDDVAGALSDGLPDGVTAVADAQVRGRGRAGRTWTHAPGQGLALSVGLHLGCDVRQAGVIPLAAGLAAAEAVERLGGSPRLKWPNDLLLGGRKLAGVLCELRHAAAGGETVVIGLGLNVRTRVEEFAPELRETATSLALAGIDAAVEDVAAEFLNALEPRWDALQEGDRATILEAWSARGAHWGQVVTVHAPDGPRTGVALRLDPDGALVLRLESGVESRVLAGDLADAGAEAR